MDCLTLHGHFEVLAHPQCWSMGATLAATEGGVRMRTPAHAAFMWTKPVVSAAFRPSSSSLRHSVKMPRIEPHSRRRPQAAT